MKSSIEEGIDLKWPGIMRNLTDLFPAFEPCYRAFILSVYLNNLKAEHFSHR